LHQEQNDGEWGDAPTPSRVCSHLYFGKSLIDIYQRNGALEKGLPVPVYHCIQALLPFVKVPNLFLTQGNPEEVGTDKSHMWLALCLVPDLCMLCHPRSGN
jgi:hypothetical protein